MVCFQGIFVGMKTTSALILSLLSVQIVSAKAPFREKVFQPVEVKSSDSCFSPGERCDLKLISFIGLAEKQVDIAVFSLTHSAIAEAIIKAKAKPEMKIRMIVDREQATAESSKIPDLKAAGIEVKIGLAKSMTHHKFTIVDLKRLETGSYNYTFNATNNNLENQVYLSEETTVKRYSDEFERMWLEATAE